MTLGPTPRDKRATPSTGTSCSLGSIALAIGRHLCAPEAPLALAQCQLLLEKFLEPFKTIGFSFPFKVLQLQGVYVMLETLHDWNPGW